MTIHKILAGALVVQCLAAAVTWMPSGDGTVESTAVFPQARDAIDRIEIHSKTTTTAGAPTVLAKGPDGWVVESQYGYPVLQEKVDKLLDALTDMRIREPIATTTGSHAKLNVTEADPTRKLIVSGGSTATTVLLGAASGNRLHVRPEGTDEVFLTSGTGVWGIGDTGSRYYERNFLKVDLETVEAVTLSNLEGELSLFKGPGGWQLDEGAGAPTEDTPEADIDQEKVDEVLKALLSMYLSEPADPALGDPFEKSTATFTWTVTEGDGTRQNKLAAFVEGEDNLILRVEDQPRAVKIATARQVQALMETTLDDLFVAEDPGQE